MAYFSSKTNLFAYSKMTTHHLSRININKIVRTFHLYSHFVVV